MEADEARKILANGYAEKYIAPCCNSCEGGELIGDVLLYQPQIELAAKVLNVFISQVSVPLNGRIKIGLLVKHDPSLCPVKQCGHTDCCIPKAQHLLFN